MSSSTMSTCESMATSLSGATDAIDQAVTTVQPYFSVMQNGVGSYIEQYINIGEKNINPSNIIADLSNQVNGEMDKLTSEIRSYSGACLDSILNPIENSIYAIEGFGMSITGQVGQTAGGLTSILVKAVNSVFDFTGVLNGLGIGSIIDVADNLFGCLSSAKCLPFGSIQKSMSGVTGMLKSVGLGGSGTFDWKTWASTISDNIKNLPQALWDAIVSGFQKMWDGVLALFDTLKQNLQQIIDGFKNMSLTSITGGLGSLVGMAGAGIGKVAKIFGGGAKQMKPMDQGPKGYVNPRSDGTH